MKNPVLLGLVGPSGSGKSTVCSYLEQKHGFIRFHVAAALKRGFCEMFRVPIDFCEQPLIEQPADFLGGVAPRAVLEWLGTSLHKVAPAALPLTAERRARPLLRNNKLLIDGLRRDTEGEMIHRLGGVIIRMVGQTVDPDKPCDLSQLEVSADFSLVWSPVLDGLYAQVEDVLRTIPGATDGRRR